MKVMYEDGPSAVSLDEVGSAKRGEVVTVSPELGEQLVAQGWKEVGSGSTDKLPKRDVLNEDARALGVSEPEKLPNKQAVADAIKDAEEALSVGSSTETDGSGENAAAEETPTPEPGLNEGDE